MSVRTSCASFGTVPRLSTCKMCGITKDDAMELVRSATALNVKSARLIYGRFAKLVDLAAAETKHIDKPFIISTDPKLTTLQTNRWYVGKLMVVGSIDPETPVSITSLFPAMGSVTGGMLAGKFPVEWANTNWDDTNQAGVLLSPQGLVESGLLLTAGIVVKDGNFDEWSMQFIGYEVTTD